MRSVKGTRESESGFSKQVYQTISAVTGHRLEDLDEDMFLESDLGVDSIKMVSLMNELINLIPPGQKEKFMQENPVNKLMALETVGDVVGFLESSRPEEADESPVKPDMKTEVFKSISQVTGHRVEEIEEDMYLEVDLGIDSIKMVALMNELMKLIPAGRQEEFAARYPVSSVMTMQTVREIINLFEDTGESMEIQAAPGGKRDNGLPEEEEQLEILNAQYPFLIAYWAVSNITIASGVTLKGELNLEALKEAWGTVVDRHPILRSAFEAEEGAKNFGQYKLRLLKNVSLPQIILNDIREFQPQKKIEYVKNKIEDGINGKFDIFSWPLHYIEVVLLEDLKYEVLIFFNHTITDGLGNQQFIRELLEIYGGKLKGQGTECGGMITPAQYNRLVGDMNRWSDQEEKQSLESYLKRQGKERFVFNPYGSGREIADGTFKGVNTRTRKYWIDKAEVKRLTGITSALQASLFVLIVSAYLKTVLQLDWSGKSIILNLPTGGKIYPNADATGIMGCFAQNLALSFGESRHDDSWEVLVKKVRDEINRAITSGMDRAQAAIAAQNARDRDMLENGKMNPAAASFIRQTVKSNLYLSFIGNTCLKEQYGDLEVCDYEAFTCTNSYAVDNLVEIVHGKILITSNYDAGFFDGAFIDSLIQKFKDNIAGLAASFQSPPKNRGKAPVPYDTEMGRKVIALFEEVCMCKLKEEDMYKDLDAELGMDSLQRIRFVTKLAKRFSALDKNEVFKARSLGEILVLTADRKEEQAKAYGEEIPYLKIMEQCGKTPDAVAIKFGEQEITYRQLHEASNTLANFLRSRGIRPGSYVGILTLPGPYMLTGMLGILKSGAAYIPVDPVYPAERIEYIIKHSGIRVLLTEHELNGLLSRLVEKLDSLETLVFMDEGSGLEQSPGIKPVMPEEWMGYSVSEPVRESTPDDIMTVLYTSGSTGTPKGVMLAHRGYMNRLLWHQKVFRLKEGERVAQRTSCCFDISVWELFWPLMFGGTVCPVRKEIVKNPWSLAQWAEDTRINIMHFVPSLFGEFIHALEDENYKFRNLRWLIFSGEVLPMSFVQKWMEQYGEGTKLANLYGPTEASIDVTCHIIEKYPGRDGKAGIPIGKPIDNVFIKILDENMREAGGDKIGELWIGGVQLAKGYLNAPEKTAECFKANPFKEIPGDYIYKTGDLAGKMPDGSLEYHGRVDQQVKIRGFRIELGEIESVLSAVEGVEEAAVTVNEEPEGSGQRFLAAWLSGVRLGDTELKREIARKLPEYMIPHRIHWMESLPKNANGKLDRKALAQGNIKEREVKAHNREEIVPDTMEDTEGADALIPLAPAQSWMMNYFDYPYSWTGYTRFMYKLPLDFQVFEDAVNEMIRRHKILRCVFVQKESKWFQNILPQTQKTHALFYETADMSAGERDAAMKELIEEAIKGFDIMKWPLIRVIVFKVSESLYDIAVVGHHLISDMLSNHILFKEMWEIYGNMLSGSRAAGIYNADRYTEYLRAVEEAKDKSLEEYLRYWKEKFPDRSSAFIIPCDYNSGSNDEASARAESFEADAGLTALLTVKMKKYLNTNVYPLVLAPLYRMLGKSYGKESVVVSHRVHGRDIGNGRLFINTPGNFAVNYPLMIKVGREDGWKELIERISREIEGVPLKGVSYDLCSDELPMYMYPDTRLATVRANYLGNRDVPVQQSFQFEKDNADRRYSLPGQKRISILEFFFYVEDKKLKLDIEYSGNLFKRETVLTLGKEYIASLKDMLEDLGKLYDGSPSGHNRPDRSRESLDGQVVIVTGGGRGIGRTIALKMAEEGASVAIIAKTSSQLEKTASEIRGMGGEVMAIPADVSDGDAVRSAIEKIAARFGRIDVLVNNAGITKMMSVMNTPPEEWRKVVEVNLFGTYNMCFRVVPYMVGQKHGKIINIGSDSSFIGYPLMSAYAASKHGILGVTKSLSEELKGYNIQINAVCPAMVNTDMTPSALRARAMEPGSIADVVLFLASKASDCITGEALRVYGKQDMHWFGSQQAGLLKNIL